MKGGRSGKYVSPQYGNVKDWTRKDWGSLPNFHYNSAGHILGFEGSDIKSFLYYDEKTKTYYTIRAHNAEEAKQIAHSHGYTKAKKKG